jgi:hypothetical protein
VVTRFRILFGRALPLALAGTLAFALAGPVTAATPTGIAAAEPARDCRGIQRVRRGSVGAILRYARGTRKRVLTFVGYSGAGYEDPAAVRAAIAEILDRHDPGTTLVNAGATADGIGVVYELARARGFQTLGIVSSLAARERVPFSPCVQIVYLVPDSRWGGELPEGAGLSPTSEAMVRVSDLLVGIGGGAIARDELLAARRAGKPVTFIPAEMNHARAREKARRQGKPRPTSFAGEAAEVLAPAPVMTR